MQVRKYNKAKKTFAFSFASFTTAEGNFRINLEFDPGSG